MAKVEPTAKSQSDGRKAVASKPRRGSWIVEREPSIQKVNRERDARINLSAKMNFLMATGIALNAVWCAWSITRPHQASPVFVQYYSQAGIMIPVDPVSFGQLPPARTQDPAPVAAPSETTPPQVAQEGVQAPAEPAAPEQAPATSEAQPQPPAPVQ